MVVDKTCLVGGQASPVRAPAWPSDQRLKKGVWCSLKGVRYAGTMPFYPLRPDPLLPQTRTYLQQDFLAQPLGQDISAVRIRGEGACSSTWYCNRVLVPTEYG